MIKKELLWKAWPDGYLPMNRVNTVSGLTFVSLSVHGEENHPKYGKYEQICTHWVKLDAYDDHPWLEVWVGDHIPTTQVSKEHERGDLLPNVDPSDMATWACLLKDLAMAYNTVVEPEPENPIPTEHGLAFLMIQDDPRVYILSCESHRVAFCADRDTAEAYASHFSSDQVRVEAAAFDTDDPALALVLARIQVREETA